MAERQWTEDAFTPRMAVALLILKWHCCPNGSRAFCALTSPLCIVLVSCTAAADVAFAVHTVWAKHNYLSITLEVDQLHAYTADVNCQSKVIRVIERLGISALINAKFTPEPSVCWCQWFCLCSILWTGYTVGLYLKGLMLYFSYILLFSPEVRL